MFNTMTAFSAHRFKIIGFDTLLMRLQVNHKHALKFFTEISKHFCRILSRFFAGKTTTKLQPKDAISVISAKFTIC